jgi:hypothetical protein
MINQIEVASRSRQNVTHQLFLDEQGKAIGCTCEFRQYNSFKVCTHMKDWNVQVEAITTVDLVPHVEDDLRSHQYKGCDFCGRNHKSWNCPF